MRVQPGGQGQAPVAAHGDHNQGQGKHKFHQQTTALLCQRPGGSRLLFFPQVLFVRFRGQIRGLEAQRGNPLLHGINERGPRPFRVRRSPHALVRHDEGRAPGQTDRSRFHAGHFAQGPLSTGRAGPAGHAVNAEAQRFRVSVFFHHFTRPCFSCVSRLYVFEI